MKEARFETQQANTRRCIQTQNYITKDLRSKSEMEKSSSTFVKVLVPRIVTFVFLRVSKTQANFFLGDLIL